MTMNALKSDLWKYKPLIEEWGEKNVEEAMIYIAHQFDRKGLRVHIPATPEMVRNVIEAVHGRLGVNEHKLTLAELNGPWFNKLEPAEKDFVLSETQAFVDSAQAMGQIMKVTREIFPGDQKKTTTGGRKHTLPGPFGEVVGLYTVLLQRLKAKGATYLLWRQYPRFTYPGFECEFIAFDANHVEVRLD